MTSDPTLSTGVGLTVVLGFASLVLVRRDYRDRSVLSWPSVGTVWLTYFVHLAVVVAAAIARVWAVSMPAAASQVVGVSFMTCGTLIFGAALWAFRSIERMSGRDTSKLVTDGIYRWSRNPQNVGWAIFLLGLSLLGRSGLALAMTALFWLFFVVYAPMEERYLERTFGQQYRAYKDRSHRYVGTPARSSA